jgi:hypothetical protein
MANVVEATAVFVHDEDSWKEYGELYLPYGLTVNSGLFNLAWSGKCGECSARKEGKCTGVVDILGNLVLNVGAEIKDKKLEEVVGITACGLMFGELTAWDFREPRKIRANL